MTEAIIQTENLSYAFGAVKAVDGLTLEVPAGIIFGFLGPNGAGKTTTIHLLLGLLAPAGGEAHVLGYDVRAQSAEIRAHSGALLEFNGLYERMTAEDNLELYGRIYGMPAEERKARVRELLQHIDLWERRKDRVNTWSRGMKQKLAVARALFHHPKLIFLDEPTAGFDPVAAAALHDDLLKLATQEGVTVFLNTHNLAEAEKLCAQVGVIREGKLITVGSPDDLRMKESSPRVEIVGSGFSEQVLAMLRRRPEVARVEALNSHLTIDLRNGSRNAPLVTAIVQAGGEVEEIHRGEASLEEVFLTLMKEESK